MTMPVKVQTGGIGRSFLLAALYCESIRLLRT